MRKFLLIAGIFIAVVIIAALVVRRPPQNPDPNHTHADFAVWIDGEKFDFSGDEFMSGSSKEEVGEDHGHEHKHPNLHLHDNVGNVIHRHKPGLSLGEFFASIGIKMEQTCFSTDIDRAVCNTEGKTWQMFRNGKEVPFDPSYVFADEDHLLLTYGATHEQLISELQQMTDDSCIYSQTCPERGEKPEEGCVADPAVPCTE
jgi:hypothetical protein